VAAPPRTPPARARDEVRAALAAELGLDHGVGSGRALVLAVGRLAPQKGYDVLLDAARGWTDLDRPPLVVVAGDGPLGPGLQARIEAERLPVRLLGHRADVPDLLRACDLVVLPSVWEARPLVAQEALRAGRPLVATAVGGIPELVGEAAVLVGYGDAAALRDAVARLLADPAECARLAVLGPEQAATWPDEADTAAQALAVYQECAFCLIR
jgi:glycosyltransferase involved in cell wall biosynthesis